MTQIYVVFMVGPIAFMLGRIDPNIIEAARDLGANFWRILRKIIFPLSLPGVVVGAIFVSVMVLGEFATSAALSGRKVNLLGNIIVTQVGSLKWALASVVGVILTVVMGIVIAGLLLHFYGPRVLWAISFPILFLIFMIPLPIIVVASPKGS